MINRAKEILEEMERTHNNLVRAGTDREDSQITFESISSENVISMLHRTNIDELTDSECRMLLNDLIEITK